MSDIVLSNAELTEEEIEAFDLIPASGRIIVKEITTEKVGSIIIPDAAKEGEMRTNEGLVIAVAEDVLEYGVRDRLYYGKFSGAWIYRNNEKYRLMNVDDVLGKVKSAS